MPSVSLLQGGSGAGVSVAGAFLVDGMLTRKAGSHQHEEFAVTTEPAPARSGTRPSPWRLWAAASGIAGTAVVAVARLSALRTACEPGPSWGGGQVVCQGYLP